jgi:hypothetical protein
MKTTIINRSDRIEAYRGNELIGYVENDQLFAIDAKGYATMIGEVSHRVEIAGKLDAWVKSKQSK